MKNITISILCTMILTISTYCPEPTNNEKKQKTRTTFVQKKSNSPTIIFLQPEPKQLTFFERLRNFAHRGITIKEGMCCAISCAIILVVAARIKYSLYPSNEPIDVRAAKDSSLSNLVLSLNMLLPFVRKL